MEIPSKTLKLLGDVAQKQTHPLLFATISGAHLYGFPSANSDFDLRGAHILPAKEVVGLKEPADTIEISENRNGIELDLVTHDVKKFFGLMLKKNGYVLEQLLSPLVVLARPEFEELKEISRNCITRHHSHHYLGFSKNQWDLFKKEARPRVKPLLYVYRVLLTGIHLMRTGEIEANLPKLNEEFRFSWLDELIDAKLKGDEKTLVGRLDLQFHEKQFAVLTERLEKSSEESRLPETPSAQRQLHGLLVRLRLRKRS